MPDKTVTKERYTRQNVPELTFSKRRPKSLERAQKYSKALGKAGSHLAAAIPILGIAATEVSAGYSVSQGDYVGAVLDEVGKVPVVGDAIDLGELSTISTLLSMNLLVRRSWPRNSVNRPKSMLKSKKVVN